LGLETTVVLAKAREMVRKNNGTVPVQRWVLPLAAISPNRTTGCPNPIQPGSRAFDAALVSRVVNEILWLPPALARPIKIGIQDARDTFAWVYTDIAPHLTGRIEY
jgi:hypothetical protein